MKTVLALLFFAAVTGCAHSPLPIAAADTPSTDGLIVLESTYSFEETLIRLEAALAARKLQSLKFDHAANARETGLSLRPTALFIFGNPRGGTPLMAMAPAAGIDLPLKALVYQEGSKAMVVINDIDYVSRRHDIPAYAAPLASIRTLLAEIATEATGRGLTNGPGVKPPAPRLPAQ